MEQVSLQKSMLLSCCPCCVGGVVGWGGICYGMIWCAVVSCAMVCYGMMWCVVLWCRGLCKIMWYATVCCCLGTKID